MRSPVSRFTAPVIASALLMLALPTHALASAPWSAGCPDGSPTSKVCIFSDWHWEGNYGNMGGDNPNYYGETYPSSTMGVNDSVSSTKNLYSSLDVRWHIHANYQGVAQCTDGGEGYYFVGFGGFNDNYSSHNVESSGTCP